MRVCVSMILFTMYIATNCLHEKRRLTRNLDTKILNNKSVLMRPLSGMRSACGAAYWSADSTLHQISRATHLSLHPLSRQPAPHTLPPISTSTLSFHTQGPTADRRAPFRASRILIARYQRLFIAFPTDLSWAFLPVSSLRALSSSARSPEPALNPTGMP